MYKLTDDEITLIPCRWQQWPYSKNTTMKTRAWQQISMAEENANRCCNNININIADMVKMKHVAAGSISTIRNGTTMSKPSPPNNVGTAADYYYKYNNNFNKHRFFMNWNCRESSRRIMQQSHHQFFNNTIDHGLLHEVIHIYIFKN